MQQVSRFMQPVTFPAKKKFKHRFVQMSIATNTPVNTNIIHSRFHKFMFRNIVK